MPNIITITNNRVIIFIIYKHNFKKNKYPKVSKRNDYQMTVITFRQYIENGGDLDDLANKFFENKAKILNFITLLQVEFLQENIELCKKKFILDCNKYRTHLNNYSIWIKTHIKFNLILDYILHFDYLSNMAFDDITIPETVSGWSNLVNIAELKN